MADCRPVTPAGSRANIIDRRRTVAGGRKRDLNLRSTASNLKTSLPIGVSAERSCHFFEAGFELGNGRMRRNHMFRHLDVPLLNLRVPTYAHGHRLVR